MKNLPKTLNKKYVDMIQEYFYDSYEKMHDIYLKEGFDNGNDGRQLRESTVKEMNQALAECTKVEVVEETEEEPIQALQGFQIQIIYRNNNKQPKTLPSEYYGIYSALIEIYNIASKEGVNYLKASGDIDFIIVHQAKGKDDIVAFNILKNGKRVATFGYGRETEKSCTKLK